MFIFRNLSIYISIYLYIYLYIYLFIHKAVCLLSTYVTINLLQFITCMDWLKSF